MKRTRIAGLLCAAPLVVFPLVGCATSGHTYGGRIGSLELTADLVPEGSEEQGRIQLESLDDEVQIEAFEAVLYEDLDGNATLDGGEARKTTRGSTPVPARYVDAVAFTLPAGLTRPRLRIAVDTNRGPTAMDVVITVPADE